MKKRFDEVLHPEMVLDLRGSMRALYRILHQRVEYKKELGWHSDVNYALDSLDVNTKEHFCITKKFLMEKPPTYRMGAQFLNVLKDVSLALKTELLPDRFFGYISFPKQSVSDGEESVQGCYVYIGPGYETPVIRDGEKEKLKLIWASYISEEPGGSIGRILAPAGLGDKSIIQVIEETENIDYDSSGNQIPGAARDSRVSLWKTILNCVLYINSSEPDLSHLKPARNMTPSERKKAVPLRNQCLIPVTFVSWNYLRPERRSGSAWVNSFPRWQRCGPNFSQVKLIWVKAHERHYDDKM